MDIHAIRRCRLRLLLNQEFNGSQTDLAARIDRQQDYVSRLLSTGDSRKNLGEKLARFIEKQTNKPLGWLDGNDAEAPAEPATETAHGWPFSVDYEQYRKLDDDEKFDLNEVVTDEFARIMKRRARRGNAPVKSGPKSAKR